MNQRNKAHYFIPAQYWKSNFELVKKMLIEEQKGKIYAKNVF